MKKVFFVLVAMVTFGFSAMAEKDSYLIDDNAIENAFNSAKEVSLQDLNLLNGKTLGLFSGIDEADDIDQVSEHIVNPWAAFALSAIVGGFGVHRHYLGTDKPMWEIYCCTAGGIFGVVPFVDCVVLLVGAIENNISEYENNNRFIMWL